jgi:CheY-like chemotaxis protein
MSIASDIAPQIPYLRRFARALTGSQESGDAYVAAALETIVTDPSVYRSALKPRVALYNVFLRLWNSVDLNSKPSALAANPLQAAADRRLEHITPRARQAFLLVALEEFAPVDAAAALEITERELATLVDEAGREVAEQVATDVLIIEDEPLIAMDLEEIVASLDHRPAGIARTHKEAVRLVAEKKPGLVLADIQLADGSSGLDAVNEILTSINVPVIFITAYPERLLTGERPEPTFLITKPFQPATVKAVISQALFFERKAGSGPKTPKRRPRA